MCVFINILYIVYNKMIRYFQLTPEILLEYVYEGDPKMGENGNKKDINDDSNTMMLNSNVFGSKYLCFKDDSEGLDSFSNLVLPLNNTETQFVVAKNKHQKFQNDSIITSIIRKKQFYLELFTSNSIFKCLYAFSVATLPLGVLLTKPSCNK